MLALVIFFSLVSSPNKELFVHISNQYGMSVDSITIVANYTQGGVPHSDTSFTDSTGTAIFHFHGVTVGEMPQDPTFRLSSFTMRERKVAFRLEIGQAGIYKIRIYDVTGRVVQSRILELTRGGIQD